MKKILIILFAIFNLSASTSKTLQEELGIYNEKPKKATCHVYFIHHGSTQWSEQKRLQGWANLPLSKKGKDEILQTKDQLKNIHFAAIYSSPLQSSLETSHMLQETLQCPIVPVLDFRGEFHKDFEGFAKDEYMNEEHFQYYDSLSPEDEIFYPCGKNGESKADLAKRVFPSLKKIAANHIGDNIIVVTHGGVFKILNFYQGIYNEELGTVSIPYGGFMQIEVNSDGIYLKQSNSSFPP